MAHIDIDPAEIGKNVPTQIPVVADAKEALNQLIKQDGKSLSIKNGIDTINKWKKEYPYFYDEKMRRIFKTTKNPGDDL